ncbi:MAG: GIY-YIG nuclease family protein [Cellulosilyticaceae bacterium]
MFLLMLLTLLSIIILILWLDRKRQEPENLKPEPEEPKVDIEDLELKRREFERNEAKRRRKQAELLAAKPPYNQEEQEELRKTLVSNFSGKRTRKNNPLTNRGFEYLLIHPTEPINEKGVYGIFCESICLYVGKTDRSISIRLKEHALSAKYITEGGAQQNFLYEAMRQHKGKVEARILATAFLDDKEEIDQLETEYIERLQPVCNIAKRNY